jgi:hypothetical protein
MAIIKYTAAQQAQIDRAQKDINTAKALYDKAKADADSSYGPAGEAFNKVDHYNGKPGTLDEQLAIGTMDLHSCRYGIHVSECQGAVVNFNNAFFRWKTNTENAQKASANLASANAAMSTLLTTLGKDPDIIAQQSAANIVAGKMQDTMKSKWVIFGIIAIIVIVGAILISRRS